MIESVKPKPIREIAAMLGIADDYVECFGNDKAKISLDVFKSLKSIPEAKYIVVTAITPTALGEGKTVTTIALSMGLNAIGKRSTVTLRQPSMGPIFGVKGGATGGGRSQVIPSESINLHLTGDIHAVTIANNLLSAVIDNHIYHGNALAVDPSAVSWRRAIDINDRSLRKLSWTTESGEASTTSGFIISPASELMAILALASDLRDLRERIGKIVAARTKGNRPVTATDLRCAGAMTAILKEAIKPNLLQTSEHTPALIHAGPFGNIAHGSSSIIADAIACRTSEYVVTESGFGADLGFEKFVDIKCRTSGLRPHAAVIVCTIRGIKVHSGRYPIDEEKRLPKTIEREDIDAVAAGCANLAKMIEIVNATGIKAVVAVNRFATDTDREIEIVLREAKRAGAFDAAVSDGYREGGKGTMDLARSVAKACEEPTSFRYLYDVNLSIKEKIERVAKKCYGAGGVSYSDTANETIERYTAWKFDRLPICMAKTQSSLSHDPAVKGRPEGFILPIRTVRLSAGAGFLYPISGNIQLMPGLPPHPSSEGIDVDDQGHITGFSTN